MKHFYSFVRREVRAGRHSYVRWGLLLIALLVGAPAAWAANPVLRIEALGSPTNAPDVTIFVDQVEIIQVSNGTAVSGAVANPSFETFNALSNGNYGYAAGGASWTFDSRSGIAQNGSAFGAPNAPDGTAVAFLQSQGGVSGVLQQPLVLGAGNYQVRFKLSQRNCCGGGTNQQLRVLVNGIAVGIVTSSNLADYDIFTSSNFFVDAPTLTAVAPNPGGLGQSITLTGTNLNSPTALTINGANALANILSNSGTSLVVRVPATATASGTVSITTAGGTATTPFTVLAPPGNALAFDGADDYVRIPDHSSLDFGSGNFTVEAWVLKRANSSNYSNAVAPGGKWNTGALPGTNEWLLQTTSNGNNNLPSFFVESGTTVYTVSSSNALTLGRWYHLAGVRSGSSLLLYVDGLLQGTTAIPAGMAVNNVMGRDLLLGAIGNNTSNSAGYFANIRLDELRIWNVARSATELQAGMTNTVAATAPGLVAYYNFDAGTAGGDNTTRTALYDLSSNANHGTLTNFSSPGLTNSNITSNWVESYALIVPTAGAATARTSTSFTATWVAPSVGSVSSYVIDVATNATFTTGLTTKGAVASAGSVSVTGLAANTMYYYRVRADKTSVTGQGAYSNVVSTTTCAAPVAVAQNVTVSLSTTGTAAVTAAAVNNGSTANCGTAPTSTLSVSPSNFSCTDAVPTTVAQALNLNGSSQYVAIPATATVPLGNSSYTIEAWIKPTQMGDYGIIGWGNYGAYNQVNALRLYAGGINNYWWGNDLLVPTANLTGAWHHVAATYDQTTNTRSIYLDGMLQGQDTPPVGHNVPSAANLRIGSTNNGEYFPGSIDEVRLWNVARTAAQISSAKGAGLPSGTAGLVAYYRLNEGSGTSVKDANNVATNQGTLTNGPTWTTSAAPVVNGLPVMLTVTDAGGITSSAPAVVSVQDNTAPIIVAKNVALSLDANGTATLTATQVTSSSSDNCGVVSLTVSPSSFTCSNVSASAGPANRYALNFDGDDRVDLGSNVITGGSYTKEAWVLARTNNCRNILSANNQQQFWVSGALQAGHQTSYSLVTDPNGSFPLNTWVHVAVSYDAAASTMRLYRNGVLVSTNTVAPTYAAGILSIGSHGTNQGCNWDGQIDEVRIWSTVRKEAEILANKGVTLTGTEAGLQAYYTFENGPNSSTLTDVTGHGYTGVLVNMNTAAAWVASSAPVSGGSLVTLTATDAVGNTSQTTATVTVTVPVTPTTTWNGTASTNWSDCANWSYGKVPDASTNVVVPANLGQYPILTSGTLAAKDLTVENGGSLTVNSGATLQVNGSFTNSGTATLSGTVAFVGSAATQTLSNTGGFTTVVVNKPTGTVQLAQSLTINSALTLSSGKLTTTSSYQVNLGGSAVLSESETSYVEGKVVVNRPLAPATAQSFGGLGLTLTPAAGSTAPGFTQVTRVTGTALTGAGNSKSIQRYFDIQPTVRTGVNVDMVFTYFNHELNGIASSDLALFKSESGLTGPWANQNPIVRTPNAVSKTGITSFSIWTLGSTTNPLPVELVSFTAAPMGAAVRLDWTTASERNSAAFEVERSLDGRAFARLGTVPAAGTSTSPLSYRWLDEPELLNAAMLYYRLRQLDHDGTVTYSLVRAVAFNTKVKGLVLTPNPARATRLSGAQAGATVQVYDAVGRLLLSTTADAIGTTRLVLPNGYPAGVYIVRTGAQAVRLVVE